MNESLHELAERYLAEHPALAEALRVFDMSREEYEKALAAMRPQWTETTSDHTDGTVYRNGDYRIATEATTGLNV